jgi:hypothetical protein
MKNDFDRKLTLIATWLTNMGAGWDWSWRCEPYKCWAKINFASVGNTTEDRVQVAVKGFLTVAIEIFDPADAAVANGPVPGHIWRSHSRQSAKHFLQSCAVLFVHSVYKMLFEFYIYESWHTRSYYFSLSADFLQRTACKCMPNTFIMKS